MADDHADRLVDPAHRDQDGPAWHRGRFEERVRRAWNAVPGAAVHANAGDLDALAHAIQEKVGGDVGDVRHRLEDLRAVDGAAAPPMDDGLVRPGADA